MVFWSAIDWWVLLVLVFGAVLILAGSKKTWVEKGMISQLLLQPILLGGLVVIVWAFNTRYILTDDELIVIAAWTEQRIRLETIYWIQPTSDRRSSPALSLDRLEIAHRGGSTIVSPRNHDQFIKEVERRRQALN